MLVPIGALIKKKKLFISTYYLPCHEEMQSLCLSAPEKSQLPSFHLKRNHCHCLFLSPFLN